MSACPDPDCEPRNLPVLRKEVLPVKQRKDLLRIRAAAEGFGDGLGWMVILIVLWYGWPF